MVNRNMNTFQHNRCWLCTMQGDILGQRMQAFIVKNIGYMDMHCIAQQVSDFVLLQYPEALGAGEEHIYKHVQSHILHPRVRLAVMLRQLLDLSNLLQSNIIVCDGVNTTVDKANAELYIKVIGQVMSLYKSDTTGMLYSQDDSNTTNATQQNP